jgi:hypothetical protein
LPEKVSSTEKKEKAMERRGRKMKTSALGVVSAAILMVGVGVGFGIA